MSAWRHRSVRPRPRAGTPFGMGLVNNPLQPAALVRASSSLKACAVKAIIGVGGCRLSISHSRIAALPHNHQE
jgi:hypothetical protein